MCDAATLVSLDTLGAFPYRRESSAHFKKGHKRHKASSCCKFSENSHSSEMVGDKGKKNIEIDRVSPKIEVPSPSSSASPSEDCPSGARSVSLRNGSDQLAISNSRKQENMPCDGKLPEVMLMRNCSDYIRNLAAKYNRNAKNSNKFPVGAASMKNVDSQFPLQPSTLFNNCGDAKEWDPSVSMETHQPTYPSFVPPPLSFSGMNGYPLMDMSSTHTLLNMMRTAQAHSYPFEFSDSAHSRPQKTSKRYAVDSKLADPLDLTSPSAKVPKSYVEYSQKESFLARPSFPLSAFKSNHFHSNHSEYADEGSDYKCKSTSKNNFTDAWTVEDVCNFVSSIEICAEYVEAFREHHIDGNVLPLLTEDHLINKLQMKVGPALKLKSLLNIKLGLCSKCFHCLHCHDKNNFRVKASFM